MCYSVNFLVVHQITCFINKGIDVGLYTMIIITFLHLFRYLVERVVPGNRVSIMGVYSIKKVSQGKAKKVLQLLLLHNKKYVCTTTPGSSREDQCRHSSPVLESGGHPSRDRRTQSGQCGRDTVSRRGRSHATVG